MYLSDNTQYDFRGLVAFAQRSEVCKAKVGEVFASVQVKVECLEDIYFFLKNPDLLGYIRYEVLSSIMVLAQY